MNPIIISGRRISPLVLEALLRELNLTDADATNAKTLIFGQAIPREVRFDHCEFTFCEELPTNWFTVSAYDL